MVRPSLAFFKALCTRLSFAVAEKIRFTWHAQCRRSRIMTSVYMNCVVLLSNWQMRRSYWMERLCRFDCHIATDADHNTMKTGLEPDQTYVALYSTYLTTQDHDHSPVMSLDVRRYYGSAMCSTATLLRLQKLSSPWSRQDVASSKSRIAGLRKIALAMAIRCFSPRDRPFPPVPSLVSYPCKRCEECSLRGVFN